ncbi:hypothetical protein BU24DRAFT_289408 [Aaosphaeria arxii CBS 175.79]|uniref:Microbial-type PARG catalytic domain-containing protein n=1 Tax=Aaosphaeria arxii CBS 175.79 TaxID=1450172 RepID=A0A6A5XHM0_9PLEO|nr:uncharacterized protein BU24DRAFT_289408 [Aaosphaeria arxii CBS 175.79]KAF2011804.1 hypothetical protein BU24DRAFT_289408 [Aaosphaeria arxii CBS 175.79]
MPPARQKPSDIAGEAKRHYMPLILKHYIKDPVTSYLYTDSASIKIPPDKKSKQRLRVAVVEGDPVDYALGWYQYSETDASNQQLTKRIPVVNMANEKRAGGDWESGLMAPEECFARRSNLVQALTMPWAVHLSPGHNLYPIPQRGGVYSPQVYVFRDGPDQNYAHWKEMRWLPVISVAPIRRPKLDEAGECYSFVQEKELMKEKMRSVLRIASYCGHTSLCIGAFGVGPIFRNPVGEVAKMWRKLLFEEEEFRGVFTDVVFAIEHNVTGNSSKGGLSEADVFREEFDPSALFPTQYW